MYIPAFVPTGQQPPEVGAGGLPVQKKLRKGEKQKYAKVEKVTLFSVFISVMNILYKFLGVGW